MLSLVLKIFFFLAASIGLFWLPGRGLTRKLWPRLKLDFWEAVAVYYGVGLVWFTGLSFVFYWLNLRPMLFVFTWGWSGISLAKFWFRQRQRFRRFYLKPKDLITAGLLLVGIVAQSSLIVPSNLSTSDGGVEFLANPFGDGLLHVSIVEQLQQHFPPLHPNFSGYSFKNYHYLYDLWLAGVNTVMPWFSVVDLYFQLAPVLLSGLFGITMFVLGKKVGGNWLVGWWCVVFSYFASSLAYVIPFIPGVKPTVWHESSFWLIQPFSMLLNPPLAISYIFFGLGLWALMNRLRGLTVWLWAGLIGFKVYAGIVLLVSLSFLSLWRLVTKRDGYLVPITLGVLLVSLLLVVYISDRPTAFFYVAPGVFLRKMVEDPDRVPIPEWILKEEHYLATHNWLRLGQLRLQELAIFIVGNLGARLILVVLALKAVLRKIRDSVSWQLMGVVTLLGLGLPHLVVQVVYQANSLQFAYYGLIVFNLAAAVAMKQIGLRFKSLPKRLVVGVVIFVIASLTSWQELRLQWASRIKLNKNTVAVTRVLHQQLPGIVLTEATDLLASSFGGKQTFVSSKFVTHVAGIDVKSREEQVNWFVNSTDTVAQKEWLKQEKIAYIFLSSGYLATQDFTQFGEVILTSDDYFLVKVRS